MAEPLTDERLAEIRGRLESTDRLPYLKNSQPGKDISDLLAEIDHWKETADNLNAEIVALRAELEGK